MLCYFADMLRCTKLKAISLVLVCLFVGHLFPRTLVHAAPLEPKSVDRRLRTAQGDLPIYSDLNGDRRPDQVQLFTGGKSSLIHINFAKGGSKQLSFETGTGDPGLVYADDIDNDNALDLIWIVRNRPETAVIFLGDGRGNFSAVSDIGPYKANLSHLYIDPFAPGIFNDFDTKNPGCISSQWNDFQLLSISSVSQIPEKVSNYYGSGIPARELDSSLAQLQVRPPPSHI
jgi:hypothetical protein